MSTPSRPRRLRLASMLLLCAGMSGLLIASAACDSADYGCSTDGDCFENELCDTNRSRCVLATDYAPGRPQANNVVLPAPQNNGGWANNTTQTTDRPQDVCLVNPFETSCVNDDTGSNEDWLSARPMSEDRYGCVQGAPFQPVEIVYEEGQICATETADFFRLIVWACEGEQFIVEVVLEPKDDCTDDYVNLTVNGIVDEPEDCQDEDVSCEVLANGGKRLQWLIKPGERNTTFYIGVAGNTYPDHVQFPYKLTARVKEQ